MEKTQKKDVVKDVTVEKKGFTVHGVGRRKSAVARVWMKAGDGKVEINGKDYISYFDTSATQTAVTTPLKAVGLEKSFHIKVNTSGGGRVGQAEAVRLGIARALLASDESLRKTLRDYSLLTVDSRKKERKKYGQKGARRKFQFVKR